MNNYREKINENNAELRECIDIAENLPDAPKTNFTMQDFIDSRGSLNDLYRNIQIQNIEELNWLTEVDTSKVVSCNSMFYGALKNIETVPLFDVSNVTNASYMFYSEGKFKIAPAFHFKQPCSANNMFNSTGYHKIEECNIIMDDCTSAERMFNNCAYLTTIPQTIKTHNCTMFDYMFYKCSKLNGNYSIDMSSGQYARHFLYQSGISSGCVLNIELVNSCNIREFTYAFCQAYNLLTLSADMRNTTGANGMLQNCTNLTNLTLKNIKTNLQVGSGTSYGHLLTIGSLVGLCHELRDTGSSKTLTVGSANLDKLANVYVKIIDVTDEMTAADDLVSEKLPFEAYVVDPDNTADITSHVTTTRVSSVDELPEGAVLMSDYVVLKNWQLA